MAALVAYFSAEGTTAKVAKAFAETIGADVFEITPQKPYTAADINWRNPLSRCNREQLGGKDVPIAGQIENFAQYDVVYLGFPIWYYAAPRIIYTFCGAYDWSGKTVHAFATSGGSGIGKTAEKLRPHLKGAVKVDAEIVHSAADLKAE